MATKWTPVIATRWTPVIRTIGVGLTLGLLLVLGAASTHAEETTPATQKAEPEAMQKAEPEVAPTHSIAGPVEGFRVHGHWTIEVRDPDGTLVERREFENALTIPVGATLLANVMGRVSSAGGWEVALHQGVVGQICDDGVGNPIQCVIGESTSLTTGNHVFLTLTVGVSASTPAEVVLSGSVIAQRDGDIGDVQTFNLLCASTIAPASCPGDITGNPTDLTNTTLATPIAVLTGQQVQVNVVISFS